MKISNIQSINFQSKQRFVTHDMKENIRFLLEKMNSETVYKSNTYYFESSVLKRLSNKKGNVEFIDGRIYLNKMQKEEQIKKETLFTINNIQLVINNETGEIIAYDKPLLVTWKKIMKKISENLEFFKNNFDNSDLVTKHRLTTQGFTEEGSEKIKEIKAGLK